MTNQIRSTWLSHPQLPAQLSLTELLSVCGALGNHRLPGAPLSPGWPAVTTWAHYVGQKLNEMSSIHQAHMLLSVLTQAELSPLLKVLVVSTCQKLAVCLTDVSVLLKIPVTSSRVRI